MRGVHLPVKPRAPRFVDLPQADRGGADRGEGGPAPQLSLGPRTLLIRLSEWGMFEDSADEYGRTALVCPQCGCGEIQ